MHIKASSAPSKVVGPMNIREYQVNENFSGALIEIHGKHGKMRCKTQDRIYFIVEGEGTFIVADEAYEVYKEDLVFIPKNTIYDIVGDLHFFMVCTPEFKAEEDEYFE